MSHAPETVSVLMLACNHGPYVRQAVESVLSQQCSVPFRLYIGEDASTDETQAVCKELFEEHPDQIELLCSDESLGMHGNFSNLWKKSSGEFVAFCEGDDYWCDPFKLQKQLDFFQEHSGCALCGTFTDILANDGTISRRVQPPGLKEVYTFEELIGVYGFHFSSVMLRRAAVSFPDWFPQVYCVDRPLYLLATQNGNAGLVPEVTSVYRLHDGGAWSTLNARDKADKSIHLFKRMQNHFPQQYADTFKRTLGNILWSYLGEALQQNDRVAARSVYRDALCFLPVWHRIRYAKKHIGITARLRFPTFGKSASIAGLKGELR